MTLPAPTYDLVLMLDLQAEEPARAKIVADTRATIEAKGELTRHDEWGERPLAYQIDHKASAEYHLLQFHAPDVELIAELNRTLHITDDVLRYRINKLKPGTPEAPEMRPERVSAVTAREEVPAHAREETPAESAPAESAPAGDAQIGDAPSEEQAVA